MSARLTLPSGYKRPRVQPFSHHLLSSSVQPDHSLLTIERVKCHFRSSSPFEMRVKGVISFDEEIRDQFLSCSPVEECLDCPWCLSGPIIIRPSASFGPELKNNDFHLPNSLLLLLLMVLASIKKENRWPQVYWDYHKKKPPHICGSEGKTRKINGCAFCKFCHIYFDILHICMLIVVNNWLWCNRFFYDLNVIYNNMNISIHNTNVNSKGLWENLC